MVVEGSLPYKVYNYIEQVFTRDDYYIAYIVHTVKSCGSYIQTISTIILDCFKKSVRHIILFSICNTDSFLTLSILNLHCHLHPLQAANCYRNSRLVVDEDDLMSFKIKEYYHVLVN